MTMLSGLPRRRAARPAASVGPEFRPCEQGVSFALSEAPVVATVEGALWIPGAGALIVSDLHLEKGASFARRGQMLPPYDTRATLARLEALVLTLQPSCVVSLGDSFHDPYAAERLDHTDAAAVRRLTAMTDFVWIEGNHDPHPPVDLGGRAAAEIRIGGLTLRHEPAPSPMSGEVAGHLHPCAAVAGRGRRIRARCFATDGARLVMPAFGAFTGGLNVCDAAFAAVFPGGCAAVLLARGGAYPAAAGRLLPDG